MSSFCLFVPLSLSVSLSRSLSRSPPSPSSLAPSLSFVLSFFVARFLSLSLFSVLSLCILSLSPCLCPFPFSPSFYRLLVARPNSPSLRPASAQAWWWGISGFLQLSGSSFPAEVEVVAKGRPKSRLGSKGLSDGPLSVGLLKGI